jgi:cytochrome c peroxidase
MVRHRRHLLVCATLVAAGCAQWRPPRPGLTEADEVLLTSMVLASPPVDPHNPYVARDDVAVLGQQWFFDEGLSYVDGGVPRAGVACAQCHSPQTWYSDPQARPLSLGLGLTGRNSPSLVNVAFYETWGWDGRADTLAGQVVHAYESAATMGGSALRAARVLQAR